MVMFSHGNDSAGDIDYDRLRRDLMNEFGDESAAF